MVQLEEQTAQYRKLPQLPVQTVPETITDYFLVIPKNPGYPTDDPIRGYPVFRHGLVVSHQRQPLGRHPVNPVEHVAAVGALIEKNVVFSDGGIHPPQGNRVPPLPQQGQHTGAVGIEPEFPAGGKHLPDQTVIVR